MKPQTPIKQGQNPFPKMLPVSGISKCTIREHRPGISDLQWPVTLLGSVVPKVISESTWVDHSQLAHGFLCKYQRDRNSAGSLEVTRWVTTNNKSRFEMLKKILQNYYDSTMISGGNTMIFCSGQCRDDLFTRLFLDFDTKVHLKISKYCLLLCPDQCILVYHHHSISWN